MSVVALVGNPRSGSRTLAVAEAAAEAVGHRIGAAGPYESVDLSALGPVDGPSPAVVAAMDQVRRASVLVVASPTYKGTYTGLLKSFVDRLPPDALAGRVALPLLVMGDAKHSLAVEVHLRPLLVELGATVPTPGLAVLESQIPRVAEVLAEWADRVAPQVAAVLREEARG
ncbi:NADPH-dependent FMN reductase [Nonomuraea jiangxiensis]|uniref:FMN reductase n=1 Tax=Nonomuraea jiangxiensis TaxID=633440 RepID=A0A1G7ZDL7_9ACTN|nr:NADPH-dependent FMN reductase [Nonomuraea jiangxiensis]SDH06190.1 FMN reductase [Nonomuraea jiangxiensis]